MCHATKRNNAGRNVNARTPPSCWPVGGDEEGRTARQEERQERRGRRRDREREQGERGTLPPYKKGGCECCVWSWTHPWVNALEPLRADDFSSLSVFACPPLSLSLPSSLVRHAFLLVRPPRFSLCFPVSAFLRFSTTNSRPFSRFLAASPSNQRQRVYATFVPRLLQQQQHHDTRLRKVSTTLLDINGTPRHATPCQPVGPVLRGFSIPTGTSAMWLRATAFLCHLSLFLFLFLFLHAWLLLALCFSANAICLDLLARSFSLALLVQPTALSGTPHFQRTRLHQQGRGRGKLGGRRGTKTTKIFRICIHVFLVSLFSFFFFFFVTF